MEGAGAIGGTNCRGRASRPLTCITFMDETEKPQFGSSEPEEKNKGDFVRRPSIRTMKTDVSEFMKTERPSLITLISQNIEESPKERMEKPSILKRLDWKVVGMVLGGGIAFIAVVVAAIVFFASRNASNTGGEPVPPVPIQLSRLSYDATQNISAKTPTEFSSRIIELASTVRSVGLLQKLIVTVTGSDGSNHPMGYKDFMRLISASAPTQFNSVAFSEVEPFLYFAAERPVFGVIIPVKSSDGASQSLRDWEKTLPRDLSFFLLGRRPESSILFFEDRSYKNLQYRFVKLAQEGDFGMGYFVFRPKNYVVITTSEETLRVVMSRLLEN